MLTAFLGFGVPVAAWLGALDALVAQTTGVDDTVRLAGMAGVIGTLTVLIYRLGVWRQAMEHTTHTVGVEVKAFREQMTAHLDRLERRLERLERYYHESIR